MQNPNAGSARLNVLVLDGGGVRGLSSLLILQALMVQINQVLASREGAFGELHPQHVFKLVAGTSTGGLIALMFGKMEMTVGECIKQYEKLSKNIFGKKQFWGRITLGLAPAKYSGNRLRKCVRKLLSEHHLDEGLSMVNEADRVACAVICREHSSSSQYSKLNPRAVPICSLPCKSNVSCKVWEAARATSAVPTFFPVVNIGDRFFADGGLAHNNPSFAIYYHYTSEQRKISTQTVAGAPHFSPHGNLDCSRVRFTNIGTGAKADEVEPAKRKRLASLLPGVIKKGKFLKQTLTEIAVDPEEKAAFMRVLQLSQPDAMVYERFNANHGVSSIEFDDHNALGMIREKTEKYLSEQETKDLLEKSHQLLKASSLMPAVSSVSSGSSNHSNNLDSESYVLFLNHDDRALASLSKQLVESLLSPDEQGNLKHDAHLDAGIDTVELENSMAAAPAMDSLLAVDP
ncbi:hypothetical protein MMC29_002620 [Sticta canariensis]|nr:hypothetical protein [Sticta canariensis]